MHTRTTSTQLAARTHCTTPSTVPLATPTQSADSGRIGTEVRRSLIWTGLCDSTRTNESRSYHVGGE